MASPARPLLPAPTAHPPRRQRRRRRQRQLGQAVCDAECGRPPLPHHQRHAGGSRGLLFRKAGAAGGGARGRRLCSRVLRGPQRQGGRERAGAGWLLGGAALARASRRSVPAAPPASRASPTQSPFPLLHFFCSCLSMSWTTCAPCASTTPPPPCPRTSARWRCWPGGGGGRGQRKLEQRRCMLTVAGPLPFTC